MRQQGFINSSQVGFFQLREGVVVDEGLLDGDGKVLAGRGMVEVVGPSSERGAPLGEEKLLRVLRELQVAVRRRHRGRGVGVARLHGSACRQGQRGGGQLLHLLEGEGGQVGQFLGRGVEREARRLWMDCGRNEVRA